MDSEGGDVQDLAVEDLAKPDENTSQTIEVAEVDHESKKDNEGEDKENGEGSNSDSEYEIEAILEAKRGFYPEGRMGYFVKWKGFPDSENSWVDEQDAGNAEDLIREYWSKASKKPKRGRTSDVNHPAKKRGRKSRTAELVSGDEADITPSRGSKKQRNSAESHIASSEDEQRNFFDLSQYSKYNDWEPYVKAIDTMERMEDNTVVVYFTLKSGERAREEATICRHRFPQKMIDFYMDHLRWKTAQELGMDEP